MSIAVMKTLTHTIEARQADLELLISRYKPKAVSLPLRTFIDWFDTAFGLCPMPVWAKDSDGKRVAQNEAYAVMYGRSKEEGLGRVDHGWTDETRNEFNANDARAANRGYVVVDEPVYNEVTKQLEHLHVPKWRVPLADGTIIVMGCVAGNMPAPILMGMSNARPIG